VSGRFGGYLTILDSRSYDALARNAQLGRYGTHVEVWQKIARDQGVPLALPLLQQLQCRDSGFVQSLESQPLSGVV
jgi:hypothetical protein